MKHSSTYLLMLLVIIALTTLAGCRKDDNPVDGGNAQPSVTTTIAGIVSNESGSGIGNATVNAYGQTVTTNQHGLFLIRNVRVPAGRCFVVVKKDGYFTASRAEMPKSGGVTHMRLGLMRLQAKYTVQSAAGGTVTLDEGGRIQFPANGFATADGQSYTGVVKVAARWLNPTSSTFFQFFPGDFAAQRSDGSQAFLYSFGVLNVELFTPSGAKLNLAPGKKAVLQYPIPAGMQTQAPSSMPLWYFDETVGMWKEEGSAVKQGTIYTGEVSHFTPWNCDVPVPMAIVEGQVHCNNQPVANITIRVGQSEVVTDNDGRYRCAVRADVVTEISIDASRNEGIGTAVPILVGPMTRGQVLTQDISVSPCPSYITGTLVDCNNQPTEGLVEIMLPEGYSYALVGRDGTFNIRVRSETALELVFQGFSAGSGTTGRMAVEPILSGEAKDLGTITACGGEAAISYTELDPHLSAVLLAFSPNGSMVVGAGGGMLHIYDVNAQTQSLITQMALPEPAYTEFSQNSARLMTSSREGHVQIWNTSTWVKENEIPLPDAVAGSGVLFHPDGESVIYTQEVSEIGVFLHRVVRYKIATGEVTELFRLSKGTSDERVYKLLGMRNNGEQVVYAVESGDPLKSDPILLKLVVWDTQTGVSNSNVIIMGRFPFSYMMQLSANGNRLLVFRSEIMQIFDADTGAEVFNLTSSAPLFGKPAEYEPVVLAPDGASFVASFADAKKKPFGIYSVQTGVLLKALPVPAVTSPDNYVDVIRFSADGKQIGGRTLGNQRQRIWHLP